MKKKEKKKTINYRNADISKETKFIIKFEKSTTNKINMYYAYALHKNI